MSENKGEGDLADLIDKAAAVSRRAAVKGMQVEHLQWFVWDHLQGGARTMAQKFAALAADVCRQSCDVQTVLALEHLLIAKDAAVRSAIAAERVAARADTEYGAVPEYVEPETP